MFEFHISRTSRDRYEFDLSIYQLTGNVVITDHDAARIFADRINRQRDLIHHPETAASSGDILAMGLIDEILHMIVADYRERVNPALMDAALDEIAGTIPQDEIEKVLLTFTEKFPPLLVYQGEATPKGYLAGKSDALSHKAVTTEELLMLWLANANPAFGRYAELFDDTDLETHTAYRGLIEQLDVFLRGQPGVPGAGESLLDVLLRPAREHPHSLEKQLTFLKTRFPDILERYDMRLLRSLDMLREQHKSSFSGPGPIEAVDFHEIGLSEEIERFSSDRDWMPSLVLVAKNTYVWLDQLSRRFNRDIHRLDQIPDEALQELARWGFSGLWLIGLWERSPASRTIKNLTGNPDAAASAYSLFDYEIAADLGGDPAYENLRERARQAGLRLAADMVPNHTGIYSKWVLEQPNWYISRNDSPYPVYSFGGTDLSADPNVGIYLEDHYFSRTDAAVVFKRVDRRSGDVRYIYHGNDGTSMPWNDTAQLNYLNAEVREAVIQTILRVARKFSVIRFDAAMTLAKKHIQRLWFPEPGQGGAIPSRSEFSLTRAEFEAAIPEEFWREVVDRVAQEVPDTLLLAEAFWLMEGYFVRTLGMHRVYNSAFMNMLRDEKNAEYRQVVKNTIAFDPQILKRYVNFMNNPDEETAVEQFGDGGKYFGVCTLMATMPGLPMFGHGQVEGFREKYGMEYRRALRAESPNEHMVARHEREIAPLLYRRSQFAEVDEFLFFDFQTEGGGVNEDVFAYSNRSDGLASLVLYHNRWGDTAGRIAEACPFAVKDESGETVTIRRSLAEGLGLPDDPSAYVRFRDSFSGLEYIRPCVDVHQDGFHFRLGAYETRVWIDFKVVYENEWGHLRKLAERLAGDGTPSLEKLRKEIELEPVRAPFRELFARSLLETLSEGNPDQVRKAAAPRVMAFAQAAAQLRGHPSPPEQAAAAVLERLERGIANESVEDFILKDWAVYLAVTTLGQLGEESARRWLDEWLLDDILAGVFHEMGGDPAADTALVARIIENHPRPSEDPNAESIVRTWLQDEENARFLNVNRFEDVVWFDTGRLTTLVSWLRILTSIETPPDDTLAEEFLQILDRIESAAGRAGHRVDQLLGELEQAPDLKSTDE